MFNRLKISAISWSDSFLIVKKLCLEGKLCVWEGLEIPARLGQLYRQSPGLAAIMKRPWCTGDVPIVSSCMVVHFNLGAESTTGLERTERDNTSRAACADDEEMQDAREDISVHFRTLDREPLTFHFPHLISFGSNCRLDIHTVCSVIETLNVCGNSKGALCLALALSVSILAFYKRVIASQMDPSELAVSGTCFLWKKESKAKKKLGTVTGTPMEEEHEEERMTSTSVWPVNTVLTVTTFAFLCDVLSKQADVADSIIVEMSLDWVKSSASLMFQLGLVGLFVPKFPAPAKQYEVRESVL